MVKEEIKRGKMKSNLEGRRFGRLTVLHDSGDRFHADVAWLCLCDCGNLTKVPTGSLRKGWTKSCGCLRRESLAKRNVGNKHGYKHGGKHTRLYRIWQAMKSRCKHSSMPSYKYYGNKGISVCKDWKESFVSFRDWAIKNGYNDNLTIDRINYKSNYEPNNCQWLTLSENIAKGNRERACV